MRESAQEIGLRPFTFFTLWSAESPRDRGKVGRVIVVAVTIHLFEFPGMLEVD